MHFPSRVVAFLCVSVSLWPILPALAADPDEAPPVTPAKGSKGALMDYGPFLSSSLAMPGAKGELLAARCINIKLGNGLYAAFDTDLMRYAAFWSGGFDLSKSHLTSSKGSLPVAVEGKIHLKSPIAPGGSASGTLDDPRKPRIGALPKNLAHYKGLYRSGDKVVLSYTIGATHILEVPSARLAGNAPVFTRSLWIDKSDQPITLVLAEDTPNLSARSQVAKIIREAGTLRAVIGPSAQPMLLSIDIGEESALAQSGNIIDPRPLTKGGPSLWSKPIEMAGTVGKPKADFPYVVDTFTLPFENPWNAWIRIGGHDLFADGKSAAICTWNGDVWTVSGIDDTLSKLSWRRFATGLYEPLGLKIVNDKLYVLGRDQITRLSDLDGDGEADFYENFNNDNPTSPQYHHFKMDLHADAQGNLYFATCGAWNQPDEFESQGTVIKVCADGSTSQVIARGLRAPNGIGASPDGQVVISDNQGHWIPSSKISYVPPGKTDGFYGFPYDPRVFEPKEKAELAKRQAQLKVLYPSGIPTNFEPPLLWVPYFLDNSSGGQAFIPDDRWGPFKGNWVHTSYGKSALFIVLPQVQGQTAQAAMWKLPLAFEGGIMRAHFAKADGQLYVSGLRGWQTNSAKDACFERVRYTGGAAALPNSFKAAKAGITLGFAAPLEAATAADTGSYDIEQWNYKWSAEYGSAEYSVENPKKKGRDTVDVKSAKLSADGKSLFLEIPNLAPVNQMSITFKLKSAAGKDVEGVLYATINRLD